MGWYHVAQICINGHLITSSLDESQDLGAAYCDLCGKRTMSKCQVCGDDIRGDYEPEYSYNIAFYNIPAYCHACGNPFPWTQAAIDAAKELIREEAEISATEQENLVQVLPDIITDTPKTALAVVRLKKFFGKASPVVAQGIKDLLVRSAVEAAKQGLGW